jgi:hypothetical protein
MKNRFFTAASLMLLVSTCGQDETAQRTSIAAEPEATTTETMLPRSASPDGARVFFITPASGDTVGNPIILEFGIEGMNIAKAGNQQPHSGHHHLLIDTDLPDPGLPIPADAHHVHFGDGSTTTEITLAAGEHTLQLLLGDHLHIPHDPPVVSNPITITVE